MEASDAFKEIRLSLEECKADGQTTVAIDALEKHMAQMEQGATDSIELRKLKNQSTLAQHDAAAKQDLEMFKSVIEAGKEALNSLVLVNGGAVVALLGFMGATISKGLPHTLGLQLTIPVLAFGAGVLTGAIGFALRYFAQACYSREWEKRGDGFTLGAIILAIFGYSLFGFGMFRAYLALVFQFSP